MPQGVEASKRVVRVDAEKVSAMKSLLDQGGQDELVKQFGTSALASDEYRAAQRQRQRAQAQRREAAEARAREGITQREQRRKMAQQQQAKAAAVTDTAELRQRLREGNKDLRKLEQGNKARTQSREQGRDRVQAM